MFRFLLVSLNIDAVLREVKIAQRRKKLQVMARGNGLSDTYTATIRQLKAQKGNKSVLGMKVLMWVSYLERPLRAEELCHALAVETGSAGVDPNKIPALRTLLSSCLGLVTVEASSSTIRFVHLTLQEHLLSDPTLFSSPHSTIAEVCLTYLNFASVWNLSTTLHSARSAPSNMPLLQYASIHWGNHTRVGMTENIKSLALRLLDRFDEHISTHLLLFNNNRDSRSGPYFNSRSGPRGFTGLHGVSFLGIAEILAAVLKMKEWDVNATDCTGSTALAWAARRGHEEVVKVLLERKDINPDLADTIYGRTPLSRAAESGHEGVVRMLLDREGVSPDREDTDHGQTPLSWAAESGHEGVVKMLLEREEVNPHQGDTDRGQTPLLWAAENGHEAVVKILLEQGGVNPNRADYRGQTPLSLAAESGHEGVVEMLLERADVNPENVDDYFNQTPLSWAAEGGHKEVVRLLLEREDVDPNTVDSRTGRSPLSWAAFHGRVGVVKILLQRKDVNTATPDNRGRTPLSLALSQRHHEVTRILLDNVISDTAGRGV